MVNAERERESRESYISVADGILFTLRRVRLDSPRKKARSSFRLSELRECGKMAGLLVRQADHLRNDESY